MEKAELLRRIVHMTALVYLVYYIVPEELFPGFYRWHGVLIIVTAVLIVEGVRLRTGRLFFGMRSYERKRISAFAWFTMAMCIALLLSRMRYVVPVIIGMALIDPFIGEIKRRREKLYPILPAVFYGLIVFSCLLILSAMSMILLLLFTLVATLSAIYAEWCDIKYIDDDFLMIVIPLIALTGLDYIVFSS